MKNDLESLSKGMEISTDEFASMKRLKRRDTTFRAGRAMLSSIVGLLSGFIPAAVVALECSSTSSSYPYAAAWTAGLAVAEKGRRPSRVLRFISIPFLLLGILLGIGIGASSMCVVTYYGVYGDS